MNEPRSCPLCGQPLYGWIALPPASAEASVGMPLEREDERVVVRCESCGVALERDLEVDLAREWGAIERSEENPPGSIAVPNRASLQAWIGVGGWAAVERSAGRLMLTPRSLELLAERNDRSIERIRYPLWGRSQGWMWQTMLNGLTFHPNFFGQVRAGRLRPANARSKPAFYLDAMVTTLGAPLVAIASIPLELIAALARRGGEIVAIASDR